MAWCGLAEDRIKWRALVNVVMIFGFHKALGSYQVFAQLGVCQLVLSSIESI
jgi:hypothetical protein